MTTKTDANRSPGSASRSLPGRYPITSYFVIAFAFSWLIEVPIALSVQGVLPTMPAPVVGIGVIAATFGPAVAAFIMTGMTEGTAGVIRLLRRFVQWRVAVRWYLFVLLGIPFIIVIGTLLVPGAWESFDPIVGTVIAAYPMAFLITLLLGGPLGEEPGWRGFALPRLQKRNSPLGASIILGLLWALWHFPLFWTGIWTPPTLANMIMFTLMITAVTIIMTWVFNHARGSLLIMILMHASFNTFADKAASSLFPATIFNEYGLLPVLIGFTITAIVLIAVTRGRLGYRSAPDGSSLATV